MLKLRHYRFTYKDIGVVRRGSQRRKGRKRRKLSDLFIDLITNGAAFDFGCKDIQRIRQEYQIFIQKLNPLYINFKLEREKEEMKVLA